LILWKAAWKPIVNALDTRAEKLRGDLATAEKTRQESEQILAEHKTLMVNSREESAKIVSQGREEAERLKDAIIEKANKEAQELTERVKKELSLAKESALNEIKAEIVILSTEIASKIIERNLKPEDQASLVQETLNKIGTVQ
jgi:F-type H+-transporting ATPase subunit b